MPFVYLAALIAAYLAVLAAYPRLRLGGSIAGAAVIAGVVAYLLWAPRADRVVAHGIPVDQVRFEELSFTDNGRSFTLSGRVQNLSQDLILRDMDVRIRIYDCPSAESPLAECETIGDDIGIARAQVPPGQVRAFSAIFYYPGLPPVKGEMRWQEEIISAHAMRDSAAARN
ncbi:MAG: hypothetical protein ACE5FS_09135 [Paracoccaceae bacterium]